MKGTGWNENEYYEVYWEMDMFPDYGDYEIQFKLWGERARVMYDERDNAVKKLKELTDSKLERADLYYVKGNKQYHLMYMYKDDDGKAVSGRTDFPRADFR